MSSEPHPTTRRLVETEDVLLLAAVLLLPWAFGGVEIWAHRAAALLLASAGAVALVRRASGGRGLGGGDSRWLLPGFLLVGWAAFQLVPLPPPVLRLISPEAHRVYVQAFPGYAAAGTQADPAAEVEAAALERVPEAVGSPVAPSPVERFDFPSPECLSRSWRTLSLEPSATQDRLAWFAALFIGFLVLRTRVADRRRRGLYLGSLFVLFVALAVFGIVQDQTWNGRLYWIRRLRVAATPFGPYVNPTHFAGVMELAVPALAAYAWSRLRRGGRAALYEARFAWAAIGAGVCLAAGLAAASKLAALLLASSLFLLFLLGVRTARARVVVVAVAVTLALIGGGALAQTNLGERFQSYLSRADRNLLFEGRLVVWLAGSEMLRDFPVAGSGFGTFREVFPRYTPAGTAARWAQAHNDYLELLVDGGVVAFGLMLWLAWGFGARVTRRVRRATGPPHLVRLGLAVGVISLAAHAFFDFNHQIPANALLFVAVCALLAPAGNSGNATEVEG